MFGERVLFHLDDEVVILVETMTHRHSSATLPSDTQAAAELRTGWRATKKNQLKTHPALGQGEAHTRRTSHPTVPHHSGSPTPSARSAAAPARERKHERGQRPHRHVGAEFPK